MAPALGRLALMGARKKSSGSVFKGFLSKGKSTSGKSSGFFKMFGKSKGNTETTSGPKGGNTTKKWSFWGKSDKQATTNSGPQKGNASKKWSFWGKSDKQATTKITKAGISKRPQESAKLQSNTERKPQSPANGRIPSNIKASNKQAVSRDTVKREPPKSSRTQGQGQIQGQGHTRTSKERQERQEKQERQRRQQQSETGDTNFNTGYNTRSNARNNSYSRNVDTNINDARYHQPRSKNKSKPSTNSQYNTSSNYNTSNYNTSNYNTSYRRNDHINQQRSSYTRKPTMRNSYNDTSNVNDYTSRSSNPKFHKSYGNGGSDVLSGMYRYDRAPPSEPILSSLGFGTRYAEGSYSGIPQAVVGSSVTRWKGDAMQTIERAMQTGNPLTRRLNEKDAVASAMLDLLRKKMTLDYTARFRSELRDSDPL